MRHSPSFFLIFSLACFPCLTGAAQSADDGELIWRLCNSNGLQPKLPAALDELQMGETIIQADAVESQGTNISKLSGNVEIYSQQEQIHADQAIYDQVQQQFDLSGNVIYRSEQLHVNAESLISSSNSDVSDIKLADFFLPESHGGGSADRIQRGEDNITHLSQAKFSTCDPGEHAWYFSSSNMKLDHNTGVGVAKNMIMRFKGIPIFYFPIVSFPIDDQRKSGFLYPTFGHSDRHGTELEIPWYWNISPQADATFTPHQMSRRGIKLNTEWRYLNSWSKSKLKADIIDDDLFGERRSLIELDHSGHIGSHWFTYLRGGEVSDTGYLSDFGDSLSDTSKSHISRTARLTGKWRHWRLVNTLQSFQTIDESIPPDSQPYRLLPEISLNGLYSDIGGGLEFELNSSYSIFDRKDRITAERFDFWPRLSRPFGGAGWFVTPSVGGRYSSYQLTAAENQTLPTNEDSISRSVPIGSLDGGLIFERAAGKSGKFLQTFEPRIYYLNVPFRDQSNIPIFDTNLPDFGLHQLFEDNRFAGADRMGDTEQAALQLSSRWINRQTGRQLLKISLGQIQYNKDRLVTLPGDNPETTKRSGILGGLEAQISRYWSTSLDLEWNPDSKQTDKELYRLRYNRDNRYIFNLGYRFRRDNQPLATKDIEQSDISFILPAGERWSLIGRWNYSIEDKLDLEKFAGFEYENCCWAFRMVAREFLVSGGNTSPTIASQPEFDRGVYLELSFKGLAGVGNGVGRRLQESVIGYQDPFE